MNYLNGQFFASHCKSESALYIFYQYSAHLHGIIKLEGDAKKLDTHFGPEFFVLEQCFTLDGQNDF